MLCSKCECCISHVCLNDSFDISVASTVDCDELAVRNFSDEQLTLLYGNLIDFKDVLIDEGMNCVDDFNVDVIKIIVENSSHLMYEDIISLGLSNHASAHDILELIEEIELLWYSLFVICLLLSMFWTMIWICWINM